MSSLISLLQQVRKREISLVWIPGHCELVGNDQADRIAKSGLKHPRVDLDVAFEEREIYEYIDKYV
jgi:ribonuclease HI